MITLERLPYVGDEYHLNFEVVKPRKPHLKIKVAFTPDVVTDRMVMIDGVQYRIKSVWPRGAVANGACFIRVQPIRLPSLSECMPEPMQCKHLDTKLVLSKVGESTTVGSMYERLDMPALPYRLLAAKLRNLYSKGYLMWDNNRRSVYKLARRTSHA